VASAGQVALGELLGLADVDHDGAVTELLADVGGVDLLDAALDLAQELRARRAHRAILLKIGRNLTLQKV
jgi:hypothetical protein